jgi:predicted nuclease of predicted toxin-antitoxin system
MNLYLDDDSAKASLVKLLKKAGHQVAIPADAGLTGASDPRHLMYTLQNGMVLLTKNHDDFEDLHFLLLAAGGKHAGLLVVRSDNDPSRDMKDRDVARAIVNLEAAGVPVSNEFHILNHWR